MTSAIIVILLKKTKQIYITMTCTLTPRVCGEFVVYVLTNLYRPKAKSDALRVWCTYYIVLNFEKQK